MVQNLKRVSQSCDAMRERWCTHWKREVKSNVGKTEKNQQRNANSRYMEERKKFVVRDSPLTFVSKHGTCFSQWQETKDEWPGRSVS
jgi:hypothetical protein